MIIANSVFDSVHSRPAHIYNRASMELIIAVLFDNKFAIPTASLIDSKLLHDIIGPFLVAVENYGNEFAKPLALYVDPVRHFSKNSHKHVIFEAAEAYLSGRAQTGRDLDSEHPGRYPLPHNFAMIAAPEVEGSRRHDVLRALRERRTSVFDRFSPYFQRNAQYLNRYFNNNPDCIFHINNVFAAQPYDSRISDKIDKYIIELQQQGIGNFEREWQEIKSILQSRNAFTRNQVHIEGRKAIADWDRIFLPYINYDYWNLLAKVCGDASSQNLELGESVDAKIAEIIAAIERTCISNFNNQLYFTEDHEHAQSDGSNSPYRVSIEWTTVLKIRNSSVANAYHSTVKNKDSSPRNIETARDKYIRFISRELSSAVNFSMTQDEDGKYTVTLSALGDGIPGSINVFGWALPILADTMILGVTSQPKSSVLTAITRSFSLKDFLMKQYKYKRCKNLIGLYIP